jgi:hypothetical protein
MSNCRLLPPDKQGTASIGQMSVTYPVLWIADELSADLGSRLTELPDAGRTVAPYVPPVLRGPAIRVGDAGARATVPDVMAPFSERRGMDIALWFGDVVVRFDDRTADHVVFMHC